jgi:phage gp36-like protein
MYATPDDLRARYDPVLLAQLAGTDGGDGDDASLLVALADATAEVNGYVGRRYPVPLVPVPAVIVRIACAIAVYNLSVLQRH